MSTGQERIGSRQQRILELLSDADSTGLTTVSLAAVCRGVTQVRRQREAHTALAALRERGLADCSGTVRTRCQGRPPHLWHITPDGLAMLDWALGYRGRLTATAGAS
jgi:predicted ArsR family transcriptional regulator